MINGIRAKSSQNNKCQNSQKKKKRNILRVPLVIVIELNTYTHCFTYTSKQCLHERENGDGIK